MPDNPETTQDVPTLDSSPTTASEPSNMPPEAPEALGDGFSAKSDNIPPSNSTPAEAENEPKTEEKQAENEPNPEPVSEPVQAIEPQTPQIPVNEALETQSKTSLARQLLVLARNAIQFRKRKKLDRIMSLFLQKSKITNDEVEKFLHVSDATATRYLSILEKENKIKQVGKTGKGVSYSRI
ncbi:MAG: hypothetical protein UU01_C0024G0013 [Parcubacteria group bacterium GW2011_GWA2_40_37]|nr:MAG: hypothetical protein UT04_C0031G0013 [Candidatus Daviesbacteria bacterium GW2011_GWF2_38_7]KKR61318.1 MAG: hypothetical protein UU01_C0024G0013 [Parcubacteria group bacterium GW2011_GWA2_40_37]